MKIQNNGIKIQKRSLKQWQEEATLQGINIENYQNSLTDEEARRQAFQQAQKIREERRRELIR